VPLLENYEAFNLGSIYGGSTHISFDGIIVTNDDDQMRLYDWNGVARKSVSAKSYEDVFVVYGPEKFYFVFDPWQKRIYKLRVW